ncbi:hypothetical protein HPB47_022620 [Ixodes persulcatus]|uniref:Uncharacterized protein n=1 Tax=Ixodes persulcatus TaxID=34615 RepID=A0AC60QBK2_IXOPE|nr:hypothetical protein HPB47_022620 [Ixodes persulcatus]
MNGSGDKDSPLRVCIVGGGPSGILCARQMLDEGFQPIVYEMSSSLGGLWAYRDHSEEGVPSIMRSTVFNSSKEMSAFRQLAEPVKCLVTSHKREDKAQEGALSQPKATLARVLPARPVRPAQADLGVRTSTKTSDFPPPKETPNYMQHTKVLAYIKSYADHFGVTRKIRLRHEVLRVTQAEDYDSTGRWDVVVKDHNGNVERQETFDAVLVASGHNGFPNVPTFKGLEKFKGKIVHTHSLKAPDQFKDRRVAVVGIGNSGIDAAVDVSRVAAEFLGVAFNGTFPEIMSHLSKVRHEDHSASILQLWYAPCDDYSSSKKQLDVAFQKNFPAGDCTRQRRRFT